MIQYDDSDGYCYSIFYYNNDLANRLLSIIVSVSISIAYLLPVTVTLRSMMCIMLMLTMPSRRVGVDCRRLPWTWR